MGVHMGVKDRMYQLTSIEQVDEFMKKHPTGVIFKAGACHRTTDALDCMEQVLGGQEKIPVACVRVVENRSVSNYITEKTGIVHQSPQFILIVNGKVVFDVDNWEITPESLEPALEKFLGAT